MRLPKNLFLFFFAPLNAVQRKCGQTSCNIFVFNEIVCLISSCSHTQHRIVSRPHSNLAANQLPLVGRRQSIEYLSIVIIASTHIYMHHYCMFYSFWFNRAHLKAVIICDKMNRVNDDYCAAFQTSKLMKL